MTSKIWRFAHLALAILSTVLLVIASVTGTILAVDAAVEKASPYRIEQTENIPLVQFLPGLHNLFPEPLSLSVDHNDFVRLEAFDADGNEINHYFDPRTGELLGEPTEKSAFIQWVTSLHRSLFLHTTGRFIVGIASFLLLLLTFSGLILLIQRQNGIRRLFSKVTRDFNSQYVHVVLGRWFLLPLLLLSATGTYLFFLRFELIPPATQSASEVRVTEDLPEIPLTDFAVFQSVTLADVQKIDFPFPDDPEGYYELKLNDRAISVHQLTGEIVRTEQYPMTKIGEEWALLWHTGRVHAGVAVLLGIASLSILLFIYSGFAITYRRSRKAGKNLHTAQEAEFILLVGSENGSTKQFASKVLQQLQALGQSAHLATLNDYTSYTKAKRLVVFTSTYGQGDAPYTANQFLKRLTTVEQNQPIAYSVVGFGSRQYEDFCGFAHQVDQALSTSPQFTRELEMAEINEKSTQDFAQWASRWSAVTQLLISTTASSYALQLPKLRPLKVIEKQVFESEDAVIFKVVLQTRSAFQSGDLLAIFPNQDAQERLYSIGKVNGYLQLIVRLHPHGLGSNFLFNLQPGDVLQGSIRPNPSFHFPKTGRPVALIANGTGIAPFLGMLAENTTKVPLHLYAGFRRPSQATESYAELANQLVTTGHLNGFHLAYSRIENGQYVMDLLLRDAAYFGALMQANGHILLCGSLAMQKDVERVLASIAETYQVNFAEFVSAGNFQTDCY